MKQVIVIGAVSAALASLGLGCGGDSSCESAIDNALKVSAMGGQSYGGMRASAIRMCKEERWSSKTIKCVAGAKSMKELDACPHETERSRSGAEEYVEKSKRSEAELNLDAIKKALKVAYVENAAFPIASIAPTPAQSCCEGPNHKCAPNPANWVGTGWDPLDFEVDEPHYFQYAYESKDGQSAVARAIGDLDCDGTTVEYTLTAVTAGGTPTFELTKPTNRD